MAIVITSTTDSPEQVTAALGGLPQSQGAQAASTTAATPPAQTTPPDPVVKPAEVPAQAPKPTETPAEVPPATPPATDPAQKPEPAAEVTKPTEQVKDGSEKHLGGVQSRINKLTAKNYALQRQLDAVLAGMQQQPNTVVEKPDPAKFETNAEYIDAATQYQVQENLKASGARSATLANEAMYEVQQQRLAESVEAFRAVQKDFDTVVESVKDIPVSATFKRLIIDSENGGPLMYEVAKDRNELIRLNNLPDIQLVKELAVIEYKLNAAQTQQQTQVPAAPTATKPTTSAPAPIAPTGGATSGVIAEDPNNMTFAQYKAWRAKNKK